MKKALVLNTLLIAVIGTLLFSVSAQAQVFEELFSANEGKNPDANLIQGSDGCFYGTTSSDVASDVGTVFKITSSGEYTILHSFNGRDGRYPVAGLVEGSDGNFYGTTIYGGVSDYGTVFKITSSGEHTVLHNFDGTDGKHPQTELVEGSDGSFYGATARGGGSDAGTVFNISASGAHTLLYSFDGTNGRFPGGTIVRSSDGSFYGTTYRGGASDYGTVFNLNAGGVHSVLHSFSGSNGKYPSSGLVQGGDGSFYGTTYNGGGSDWGTVFKITASGTYTRLHSFNYGSFPLSGLVQGSDGNFYGTTYQGGASGYGTVFKITASGTHTLLHSFNGTNGSRPSAGLVQGSDGSFYGTTYEGGVGDFGTVFKTTSSGTHTLLRSFDPSKGSYGTSDLAQGSDGNFYGTTSSGGGSNSGTVFKITANGAQTILHSFSGTDGKNPTAGLVQGNDGSFYGTTYRGGSSDYGTVFKITSGGTHMLLHSFNSFNGSHPQAGLVLGNDGSFYGTTYEGGASGSGTVYKITASGIHTLLHSCNWTNGNHPLAGLVQGRDGDFYGTTSGGGATSSGTVFKITSSGTHTLLYSFFHTYVNGRSPIAGLVQGSDGSFYGTTYDGGVGHSGTVFKITSGGSHKVLYHFDGINGRNPTKGLTQGSDGNFYGTTREGGAKDFGTLFRITPSGIHTVIHSFDSELSEEPRCTPTFGTDGNLYGTANQMCVWRIVLAHQPLHSKGSAVPGAGVVGSGIPAGAVWHRLGVPALSELGQIALLGEWKVGASRGQGLFYQDTTAGQMTLLAAKGEAVPGVPNAVYSGFKDPLLADDGAVVSHAILANAPSTTGAVKPSTDAAIFLDGDGSGGDAPVLVAREGDVAAGTASAKWASFDSMAVSEGAVAFLGKMVVSASASVSLGSDTGLWIYDRDTATTSLMLREGDVLLGSKVKTISALTTRTKAGGQGRGVITGRSEDQISLRVTLTNGRTTVGVASSPSGVSFPYQSTMPAVGYGTGALWSSFGVPGQNRPGGALCFRGVVKPGTGTATGTNNIALFSEDDTTLTLTKRYGATDDAWIFGGVFSGFSDPVNGSGGALAFIGSMASNSAEGITSSSNDGVWYDDSTVLNLMAREGAQPPGVATGARWKSFNTVALPEGRGPIFVATLEVGRAGITTGKDKGVWATDSAGAVKKLIQEGDPIGTSKVASFQVLSTVSGSPAQTRSFNSAGEVVMQVTDTAGGTHLLHVAVP